MVVHFAHGRIAQAFALEVEGRHGFGGQHVAVGRGDAHVDRLFARRRQFVGRQHEVHAQAGGVLDARYRFAVGVERRQRDVAGADHGADTDLVVQFGGLLLGHFGAQFGRRDLLAVADVFADESLVERIQRVDLTDVALHDRTQRTYLFLVLLDFGEVPRTLLLEARHQRVGAVAFDGQPRRDAVVGDLQVVEVGHQPSQIVLDRVAVALQQPVVDHLLAVDAEIERRKGHQNHRQDDDDDAVAADGFARVGLGSHVVVVLEFRGVVSLLIFFHKSWFFGNRINLMFAGVTFVSAKI